MYQKKELNSPIDTQKKHTAWTRHDTLAGNASENVQMYVLFWHGRIHKILRGETYYCPQCGINCLTWSLIKKWRVMCEQRIFPLRSVSGMIIFHQTLGPGRLCICVRQTDLSKKNCSMKKCWQDIAPQKTMDVGFWMAILLVSEKKDSLKQCKLKYWWWKKKCYPLSIETDQPNFFYCL